MFVTDYPADDHCCARPRSAIIDAMHVTEADASMYEAFIDLAVQRNPTMGPEDVGWQLMVPETWPDLRTVQALDDARELIGWGWMATGKHAPPGRTGVWVTVRRDAEGQGVGGAIFRALAEHRPASASELRTSVRDSEPRALEVAKHWGFLVEELSIESELELAGLPPTEPAPGITLESCPELGFPDQEAVEAMLQASQTNPEAQAGGAVDLASIRATSAGATSIAVLARVDGAPAAITAGTAVNGFLFIGYTGVDPTYRGRGLAKLVKQQAHLDAAAAGATISRTENEENNAGIRRVNRELGYGVLHGTYRMRLPLTP